MSTYWKDKVLPKIKKIFEKNGPKKAAAAEATKAFDEAKEQYSNEFEEKKTELQPKVVEIYEAATAEIKTLVKDPKGAGLKKHSAGVQKFLDELVKIEFPGSKAVSEASSKFSPSYVSAPILFVFEKVSTFIVVEDKKKDEDVTAPAAETEATPKAAVEEPSGGGAAEEVKEKEVVVEAETTKAAEEPAPAEAAEKTEAPPAKAEEAPAAAVAAAEPPKV